MDQKGVESKESERQDGWMEGRVEGAGGRRKEWECFVIMVESNDLRIAW